VHHLRHVVRLDPGIYVDNTYMFHSLWSSNALLVKIVQLELERRQRWWVILDFFIASLLKQTISAIAERRGFLVMADLTSLKALFFGNLWMGGCCCHLLWHLIKSSRLIPRTWTWNADIADEFKVPRYYFSPSPTHFISLVFGLLELNPQGHIPAQLDGKPYTIPGFPPILPFDLPRL